MQRIPLAYEKMLLMERLAGDPRLTRHFRLKASVAARRLRGIIEQVPEND